MTFPRRIALVSWIPPLLSAAQQQPASKPVDRGPALGGASHMGRRDIAEFLLSKGARMDLFAAAMLGKTEIIQAMVAAYPGIEKTPGPHKIPLIAHAKRGGETAAGVVKYLESLA